MLAQPQDTSELQGRLETLGGLIARYRRCLEQGASPKTAAAYQQAIQAAEAEIAEIERRIADLVPSEEGPATPK
jgi:cell division protein FtsB